MNHRWRAGPAIGNTFGDPLQNFIYSFSEDDHMDAKKATAAMALVAAMLITPIAFGDDSVAEDDVMVAMPPAVDENEGENDNIPTIIGLLALLAGVIIASVLIGKKYRLYMRVSCNPRRHQGLQTMVYGTRWAGSHLHLTGETIAPSAFSSLNALSISFLSMPVAFSTSPALMGFPAAFMAFMTSSLTAMTVNRVQCINGFGAACSDRRP